MFHPLLLLTLSLFSPPPPSLFRQCSASCPCRSVRCGSSTGRLASSRATSTATCSKPTRFSQVVLNPEGATLWHPCLRGPEQGCTRSNSLGLSPRCRPHRCVHHAPRVHSTRLLRNRDQGVVRRVRPNGDPRPPAARHDQRLRQVQGSACCRWGRPDVQLAQRPAGVRSKLPCPPAPPVGFSLPRRLPSPPIRCHALGPHSSVSLCL